MKSKYCELYDSFYDSEKDIWLDSKCADPKCEFCAKRPDRPSDVVIKRPYFINNSGMITIKELKEIIEDLDDNTIVISGNGCPGFIDPVVETIQLNKINSKHGNYYLEDKDLENYKINQEDTLEKKCNCLVIM